MLQTNIQPLISAADSKRKTASSDSYHTMESEKNFIFFSKDSYSLKEKETAVGKQNDMG